MRFYLPTYGGEGIHDHGHGECRNLPEFFIVTEIHWSKCLAEGNVSINAEPSCPICDVFHATWLFYSTPLSVFLETFQIISLG